MLIDITVRVSRETQKKALENETMASMGHLGTHFDVMNSTFPLCYTKRSGIVFDVSGALDADIELNENDLSLIQADMFVSFYSGFIKKVAYGSKEYFKNHPQLSHQLVETLLEKHISIIGIDFAGIRRGKEHTPKDQYCADKGVFIVENLCNLDEVLQGKPFNTFTANTYPISFEGLSGLPCRVVAEI